MRPRTRRRRRWLGALAPVLVAGTFTLAANAAVGLEPSGPSPFPDLAFRPVTVAGAPKSVAAPASSAAPLRTPDLRPMAEPWISTPPPDRAQPNLRASKPIVVPIAPPAPEPLGGGSGGGSHSLRGNASWYCRAGVSPCTVNHPDTGGFNAYAAAGPDLRAAIGPGWRGTIVTVDGIKVKLIDWCQCYKGEPHEKLLDLYYDVFARTGTNVTIRW